MCHHCQGRQAGVDERPLLLPPSLAHVKRSQWPGRARLRMTLEPLLWLNCSVSRRACPGLASLGPHSLYERHLPLAEDLVGGDGEGDALKVDHFQKWSTRRRPESGPLYKQGTPVLPTPNTKPTPQTRHPYHFVRRHPHHSVRRRTPSASKDSVRESFDSGR